MLLDIHTHTISQYPLQAIHNHMMQDTLPMRCDYYSACLHPWYLTEDNFRQQVDWMRYITHTDKVIAIGEAGLDKVCVTPFDLQMRAFKEIIKLSEEIALPLIIHAVRASVEIIALKKEFAPREAWIIHGFRGKKEFAEEYLRHGFYLSFGEKYQEDALKSVSSDCLFLETDESETDICELYARAASLRNIPLEEFIEQVQRNIRKVFFK